MLFNTSKKYAFLEHDIFFAVVSDKQKRKMPIMSTHVWDSRDQPPTQIRIPKAGATHALEKGDGSWIMDYDSLSLSLSLFRLKLAHPAAVSERKRLQSSGRVVLVCEKHATGPPLRPVLALRR